jgi:elongation factor P
MTIGHGELRKGMAIDLDGEAHFVLDVTRTKKQQRAPVIRIKMRELRTGRMVERTFQGYDVKLTPAAIERRDAQYIYNDGDHYYFMDTETFDQFPLTGEQVGEALRFLVDQTTVQVVAYQDEPVTIELPTTVDLVVTDSPPGLKGDTAQGGTKPATLETGLKVQVPLFVNEGERVRVDTRTGEYLSRV